MKNFLDELPISIAGLMLALASLGNLLHIYGETIRYICGGISVIIYILLTIKIVTNRVTLREELRDPVIASVFPTYSMGIMILSTYFARFSNHFGITFWIIGFSIQIINIIYFFKNFILKFQIKKVFPSYFIPFVGMNVGSITASSYGLFDLSQCIFYFAFASYLILLPIIVYRVFKIKGIKENYIPTIAIFASSPSLCIVGYISSFNNLNNKFILFLLCIDLISTSFVIIYLFKMLKIKFYPSYSSFTFPLVISAISMRECNKFLIETDITITILKYLESILELTALCMVVYVFVRYILYLYKRMKPVNN